MVGWTLERLALSALSVGSGVDFSFRSAVNGELSRCKSWAAFRIPHPTRLNVRSITCYDHNQPHIVPHRLTSLKILPNTKTSPGSLGFYMHRLCYKVYSPRLQWNYLLIKVWDYLLTKAVIKFFNQTKFYYNNCNLQYPLWYSVFREFLDQLYPLKWPCAQLMA